MLDRFLAGYFRHRSSLLLLVTWPVIAWSVQMRPTGAVVTAAGAAIAAAGVTLRLRAVRRIGRGARVSRAHASAGLIDSGPFAWSRNPLYLAAGLILCGLALVVGAGLAALLMPVLVVAIYTPVVLHEEKALAELLGPDYLAYRAAVPRWIGPRGPRPPVTSPGVVPWSEVLRREKLLVPGATAALIGLWAVRTGLLPLARGLTAVGAPLGIGAPGVAGLCVLAGVAFNSVKIERKRRQRARAREARAKWKQAAAQR